MLPFFDSRHPKCKQPYGAVPCGTEVALTLYPLIGEDFLRCTLLCWQDFSAQGFELSVVGEPFPPYTRFSLRFTVPASPELLWYAFRLTRSDGSSVYLGKNGLVPSEEQLSRWQLTVYQPTSTPSWFGKGITYQIFPDRFHRLALPQNGQAWIGSRSVHWDWNEGMEYRPTPDGEITNSDFFGGSLVGIQEKLPYLASLGVNTLYLCPIFAAASNHRYDTADYLRIDPMLGSEADFSALCQQAEQWGIRILLDGVFNHTGSNSVYFNRYGTFPTLGAYQSPDSPYADWYSFSHHPDSYESWWGIQTLPALREDNPNYLAFLTGENGVVRHWLRAGASGWRLDVADELPDVCLESIRSALESENKNAILIGEVWEDGSNKIAYDRRRKYLLGRQCHGLMNYPFRTATLAWLLGGGAEAFRDTMETLRENYPPTAFYSAMNFLGTHDTPRILTLLGSASMPLSREERASIRLTAEERQLGLERLRLAVMLLYTFAGSPTIFYGDEVGMEGWEDPFNRATFPWGQEDRELLRDYQILGSLRTAHPALQEGDIHYLLAEDARLVFTRRKGKDCVLVALNRGDSSEELVLPSHFSLLCDALSQQRFLVSDHLLRLTLPPRQGVVLVPVDCSM